MERVREILLNCLTENLEQVILSNSADKEYAIKITLRPVMIKGELLFQETLYRGTQVFHQNYTKNEMQAKICDMLSEKMKQGEITCVDKKVNVLVSKKGTVTIKTKQLAQAVKKERTLSHNRTKEYILEEGKVHPFLVGLGVQTQDGKVSKNRYDKFKQINRYLEFIEDILDKLPKDRTIRIIDFGCGKSYLTFAMYYYLHELQKRDVAITGLDLKKDVIAHCNQLAKECGYEHLTFEVGDIGSFEGCDAVDMVVSLHACDVATDYALEKAVRWGAKVILAVPCCQHEVNKQIKNKSLMPALKYGLIKERMSALLTDAIRANLLEQQGYDTQILEFIDIEHTPKNILIRAVKKDGKAAVHMKKETGSVYDMMDQLCIEPTLKKLLEK